jgi:RNA-directed DNA polymerase
MITNNTINNESIMIGTSTNRTDLLVEKQYKRKIGKWHNIDWKAANEKIQNLQERIVIATQRGDNREIYKLQWDIIQSFSGRALAVRKVVTNSGGKTAGVDKVIWRRTDEYYKAIVELLEIVKNSEKYNAKPLRRVWIPKGNGEKRPLGIPTLIDRAVQAVYALALDPVVETNSDPNSFGFRKCRSTHDAITAIRSIMDKKTHPRWILEVDIAKCFDKISHEFLLKNTKIIHKHVLKQWLQSGVLENKIFTTTEEGTPQGGIISPILCNIALNGIEKIIMKANPLKKGISSGVHLIRYADDMVVTGKNEEICERNKKIIEEFLKSRGLNLNQTKTKLVHIKEGFDFLGFNIRRMEHDPRLNKSSDQDTVLIIKPSIKGIKKLKTSISEKIDKNKPIEGIIRDINPILRGWANHKRISYHSQPTFIRIDHWMYLKMMAWVNKHKGSKRTTVNRYLIATESRKWNWGKGKDKLLNIGETTIISPRPLKQNRNPYMIKDMEYYNERRENGMYAKFRKEIYKKYKYICHICGDSLMNGERVELHHIEPRKKGGKYDMKNIQPLHQICHQKITYINTEKETKNE